MISHWPGQAQKWQHSWVRTPHQGAEHSRVHVPAAWETSLGQRTRHAVQGQCLGVRMLQAAGMMQLSRSVQCAQHFDCVCHVPAQGLEAWSCRLAACMRILQHMLEFHDDFLTTSLMPSADPSLSLPLRSDISSSRCTFTKNDTY